MENKKYTTRVYTWGVGDAGQLGVQTEEGESLKPIEIPYLNDKRIKNVVCGGMHSLALSIDGTVYSWGCNDEGVLGREGNEEEPAPVVFPTDTFIKEVVAGDSISAAVDEFDNLWTWGLFRGPGGVIGHSVSDTGKVISMARTPTLVPKLKVMSVSAGCNHLAVVDLQGRLNTWGDVENFKLGRVISKRAPPTEALKPGVAMNNVSDVAVGAYHTLAVQREKQPKEKTRVVDRQCLYTEGAFFKKGEKEVYIYDQRRKNKKEEAKTKSKSKNKSTIEIELEVIVESRKRKSIVEAKSKLVKKEEYKETHTIFPPRDRVVRINERGEITQGKRGIEVHLPCSREYPDQTRQFKKTGRNANPTAPAYFVSIKSRSTTTSNPSVKSRTGNTSNSSVKPANAQSVKPASANDSANEQSVKPANDNASNSSVKPATASAPASASNNASAPADSLDDPSAMITLSEEEMDDLLDTYLSYTEEVKESSSTESADRETEKKENSNSKKEKSKTVSVEYVELDEVQRMVLFDRRRKMLSEREEKKKVKLSSCGVNNYGQCPYSSASVSSPNATGSAGLWGKWRSSASMHGPSTFKKGMGGEHSTHILDSNGDLWSVGRNTFGQLGVGDSENRNEFTKSLISDVDDFSITSSHGLALSNGKVFSWGFGDSGQLGYEAETQLVPREVELDGTAISIGAGGQHSAAVVLTESPEIEAEESACIFGMETRRSIPVK